MVAVSVAPFKALLPIVLKDEIAEEVRRNHDETIRELQRRLAAALVTIADLDARLTAGGL